MDIDLLDLPVLTVNELGRAYEDLRDRLADYNGVHADRLHARLQAIADELHTRAGRENVTRSMATDDLQDMLPDFEQVAAVCGIRPEQARMNRQIVVDELARRAATPISCGHVQTGASIDHPDRPYVCGRLHGHTGAHGVWSSAAPREDVVTLTQDLTRYPLDN